MSRTCNWGPNKLQMHRLLGREYDPYRMAGVNFLDKSQWFCAGFTRVYSPHESARPAAPLTVSTLSTAGSSRTVVTDFPSRWMLSSAALLLIRKVHREAAVAKLPSCHLVE